MFLARICRTVTLLNRFQKLATRCSTANVAKNRSQPAVTLKRTTSYHCKLALQVDQCKGPFKRMQHVACNILQHCCMQHVASFEHPVAPCSNFMQHRATSSNIVQQGVQTMQHVACNNVGRCCMQHVAFVWTGLNTTFPAAEGERERFGRTTRGPDTPSCRGRRARATGWTTRGPPNLVFTAKLLLSPVDFEFRGFRYDFSSCARYISRRARFRKRKRRHKRLSQRLDQNFCKLNVEGLSFESAIYTGKTLKIK